MEIPKPVGCISRDLTMQEVLIFITIRVTLFPNVLLQDLKEESRFSILYYQAIKVCKPVLIIYCVCTFVVVSKSTV